MTHHNHPLPGVMRWLTRFEIGVNVVLLMMMTLIVTLSIVDLGFIIRDAIVEPPYGRIGVDKLVGLFSDFLLVLIGVELLETVRSYIQDKTIHVEVILAVGLVAIARKIIVLEPSHIEPMEMIGIGVVILALAVAFFLVHRVLRENEQLEEAEAEQQHSGDQP
jgi:uncharacterized membrane protein (DUF373 family)